MGTTGQSITLANSIIGVGILAMPFCFQQCGILLATLILISMGLVSRLCCYFLLKSAIITRRRNYEFLAFHIFGPSGKMAVELGIIGFLMGTCIAYFVVVGDLGPQIIAKLLNINQSNLLRTCIMVIVSLVCVLPLGLLRNVDSLSNVSAATIAFYFCLVIKVIAEATTQLFTSDWTSRIEMWKPSGVLQCVPIFSMALFCQTQLFEIFESLPTLSLEKMYLVTKNAINICSSVYFTLGVFGYIAFGSQEISGSPYYPRKTKISNVLMSLSPTLASDLIKLGFVLSVALSFPLIIFPCRASLYSFLYRRAHPMHEHSNAYGGSSIPTGAFRSLTVGIVGMSLGVGLLLPTVELVLGLLGATVGVLVCVVLPAAAFLNLPVVGRERGLAKFTVILGLIILVLGTYANLQAADLSREKYDDRYITQERIDKMVEDFFQKMDKYDDALIKPKQNVLPQQDLNLNNPILKDSEVQPPNPVPPESHSNEKQPVEEKMIKQMLAQEAIDKVSESHPKNIKLKLNEENVANGAKPKIEEKPEDPPKLEKIKPLDTKEDKQPNQDKIDMMKQQQLIETIKQHGKEQQELMEEQKEIMDEILKTKEELQKNKKEIDSNEAKKIAVESIKKIANEAIKSLSGVTDAPIDPKDIKDDPLKKIASDAVKDINKKAEETLDAIKHIEEVKVKKEIEPLVIKKEIEPPVVKKAVEPQILKKVVEPPVLIKGVNEKKNTVENHIQPQQPQVETKPVVVNFVPADKSDFQNLKVANIKREIPVISKQSENPQPVKSNLNTNSAQEKPKSNINNKKQNSNDVKEHSHLPDEPQSYKLGEDAQNIEPININNIKNGPLVLAMIEKEKANQKNKLKQEVENGAINFKEGNSVINENIIPRRKREVVDCTEKTTLKPEDKQICEDLVNQPKSQVFLENVDLGAVGLSNLPVKAMLHHMRSLKSVQEDKRR